MVKLVHSDHIVVSSFPDFLTASISSSSIFQFKSILIPSKIQRRKHLSTSEMSSPPPPTPPTLPDHDTIHYISVIFLIGEGIIIAQVRAAEANHELLQAREDEYYEDRVSESLQERYHDALTTSENWIRGYRLALQDLRLDLLDIYGVNITPDRLGGHTSS